MRTTPDLEDAGDLGVPRRSAGTLPAPAGTARPYATRADRAFWPLAATTTAVALAARLWLRIDYAEEIDSLRFLIALENFDLTTERPHFPGYPVFIALGRLFLAVTGDPVVALGALCATAGAALGIPVALLTRAAAGPAAGCWALILCAANPLLWLTSQQLLSDMPGLLGLFAALAVLAPSLLHGRGSRRRLALGFFLLGVTLGVRLSYFPFVASALVIVAWRSRAAWLPMAAFAAGVLIWAVPLAWDTGWEPLVATGATQGGGHFTRWGGTIVTRSSHSLRLSMLTWELTANGLGTWWTDRPSWLLAPTAGLALVLALGLRRLRPDRVTAMTWALLVAPYLAWIYLGQNITVKPRHALPLVVLAVVALAVAAARASEAGAVGRRLAAFGAAALLCGHVATGLALAREHQAVPSNAVRLARELGQRCAAAPERRIVVYTASLQRHIERYAPCAEVVVVRRAPQVKRDLGRRPPGTVAYVASDVARLDRLRIEPVLRLRRSRYIQNALNELQLYMIAEGGSS